jgi:hypothetical protein
MARIVTSDRDSAPGDSDSADSFASRAQQADEFETAKERALRDPGPGWREWFLFSGAKTWVVLGFFIIDSWLFAFWFSPFNAAGMVLSLVAAVYLEFLAYRYLWYRWNPEHSQTSGPFRPSLLRPREVGLWTPEAALAKQGKLPRISSGQGPRREEFL